MVKQVAWSHSALNTFRTCPKKYYHEKIKKDVKFTETEASSYGKQVHKAFEDYVGKGKKLPFGMAHYKPYLDKFREISGEKLVEQKMAITREFQSTGYFDKDVWFRGQADLIIINGSHAIVIDYKTGKLKDDFDQLDLMAACAFCLDPDIHTMTAMFFWTKDRSITSKEYKRDDARDVWNRFIPMVRKLFIPMVRKLEVAVKTTDFPPKTNGLCRSYCEVKSCPYNGG
jgi:RecB family exonuclease